MFLVPVRIILGVVLPRLRRGRKGKGRGAMVLQAFLKDPNPRVIYLKLPKIKNDDSVNLLPPKDFSQGPIESRSKNLEPQDLDSIK